MSKDLTERRLAAILVADIVGYSRMMGEDETRTLAALREHRAEVIEPLIDAHRGRVVKFMGDGVLAEFASVTEAVAFAVRMQRVTVDREAAKPEGRRISFRVGVNLGEVITEGGDIYGDGVNVAARLQEIAEPDSVCVSAAAHAQIDAGAADGFESIGAQRLKNIAAPVRAFLHRAHAPAKPSYLGKLPWVDLPAEKPAVLTGRCLCGAVRFEVSEPDLGAMYCHCSMCRRFTGGPVASGVTVRRVALRWTDGAPKYYRSSNIAERGFCADCGSALVYKSLVGEWTQWLLIFSGCLDNPEHYPPVFHLGAEGALSWLKIDDDYPRMTCFESPSLRAAYEAVGEEVPGPGRK